MAVGDRTESAGPLDVAKRLWQPRLHAVEPCGSPLPAGRAMRRFPTPSVSPTARSWTSRGVRPSCSRRDTRVGTSAFDPGGVLLTGDAFDHRARDHGSEGPAARRRLLPHRRRACRGRPGPHRGRRCRSHRPRPRPGVAWHGSRRGSDRPARRMNAWLRPLPSSRPFHQLARNDVHRWWRPVGWCCCSSSCSVLAAMLALALGMVIGVWTLTGRLARVRSGSGDELFTNDLANLFALIGLGRDPPARGPARARSLIDRRPIGSLSSVQGRLRWRWLALCLLPAIGLHAGVGRGVVAPRRSCCRRGMQDAGDWVGWSDFWPALARHRPACPGPGGRRGVRLPRVAASGDRVLDGAVRQHAHGRPS